MLYHFIGTVSTVVTVPDLSQYKTLILTLLNGTDDRMVEGSITMPSSTFWTGGGTMKVYGSTSSMWGSCAATKDNSTEVTFNRTVSNTGGVKLFGIR